MEQKLTGRLPRLGEVLAEPGTYFRLLWKDARDRYRDDRAVSILLFSLVGLLVAGLGYWVYFAAGVPSVADLREVRRSEASIVFTSDGEELARYHDENRVWVPLDSISIHVVSALVAAEDHRFFDHWGIDARRTFASVIRTLQGETQGGSTITMQLARNAFDDIGRDATLIRKFKEWYTALQIEEMYSKAEILEMYLNSVPFMYGTIGIETAASTYFQKRAIDLDLSEAATLVGMLKATVTYNPVRNPEASHERRNVVLSLMTRYGLISPATLDSLRDMPTELNFRRTSHEDNLAPYFAEHLRTWLTEWAERNEYDLYRDGLRIYTTIDSRLQTAANEAVREVGDDLQSVADVEWSAARSGYFSGNASNYRSVAERRVAFDYFWQNNRNVLAELVRRTGTFRHLVEEGMDPDSAHVQVLADSSLVDSVKRAFQRLESGLVAIDPQNGHIKVWTGGRDFAVNKFDHVAQLRRQPGSTFKPFVYAAALDHGFSPDDLLLDEAVEYVDPHTRRRWAPRNVGRVSGEPISLRDALAYSKNTVTAQLGIDLGPDRIAQYASNMGVRSRLYRVPSLSLGTSEVSLLELTSAYATIVSAGTYHEPIFVQRIEDRHGRLLEAFSTEARHALNPSTAYTLLDMLRSAVDYGTGQRIRGQFGARGDLAGKTGTTQNGADGWFVLMHPNMVVGAWTGFPSPRLSFRSNYWGQGSRNALPVVGRFFRTAGLPTGVSFERPAGYRPPSTGRMRFAYDDQFGDYDAERWIDSLAWGDHDPNAWAEVDDWEDSPENPQEIPEDGLAEVEELNRRAREASNVGDILDEIRAGRE